MHVQLVMFPGGVWKSNSLPLFRGQGLNLLYELLPPAPEGNEFDPFPVEFGQILIGGEL